MQYTRVTYTYGIDVVEHRNRIVTSSRDTAAIQVLSKFAAKIIFIFSIDAYETSLAQSKQRELPDGARVSCMLACINAQTRRQRVASTEFTIRGFMSAYTEYRQNAAFLACATLSRF